MISPPLKLDLKCKTFRRKIRWKFKEEKWGKKWLKILLYIMLYFMKIIFDSFFKQKVEPWQRARSARNGDRRIFFTGNKMRNYQSDLSMFFRSLRLISGVSKACVVVEVSFYLERPKSSPASIRPFPSVKPDLDNLIKNIGDAGNKVLWLDDAQIVSIIANKFYAEPGQPIGTKIKVSEL